jgi:hypothetical protein
VHLGVKLQFNSWSDRHGCNNYFQFQILTIGGVGNLTGLSGDQTMGVAEPSGLTPLYGGQTTNVVVASGLANLCGG